MKALTLIQPWAWAICHAGKRIENRTWRPSRDLWGQRIAIHAGKILDEDSIAALLLMGVTVPADKDIPRGAIVAIARLIGMVERVEGLGYVVHGRGEEPPAWVLRPKEIAWFCGPIGWILDEVEILAQSVKCRGMHGLWTVPKDVEQRLRFTSARAA